MRIIKPLKKVNLESVQNNYILPLVYKSDEFYYIKETPLTIKTTLRKIAKPFL